MRRYRRTQVGWLIIIVTVALGAVFVLTNRALLTAGPGPYPLALFPLLLLLFGTLTVTVENGELRARFGIGLIGETIRLADVESFGVVKNPRILGWGIRFFPGGTLYNVSGLHAVELRLRNGRACRIGSDQPHALESAIRTLIGESRPLPHADPGRIPGCRASGRVQRVVGATVALVLLGLIGFALCLAILEPKPPRVAITPQTLAVRSFAYKVEVPLREIVSISLEPGLPCILRRTNGFAAAGLLRGHFDVQGLGNGMLFLDAGTSPYLVVRTARSFVIVNYGDPRRTSALQAELQAAWARVR